MANIHDYLTSINTPVVVCRTLYTTVLFAVQDWSAFVERIDPYWLEFPWTVHMPIVFTKIGERSIGHVRTTEDLQVK